MPPPPGADGPFREVPRVEPSTPESPGLRRVVIVNDDRLQRVHLARMAQDEGLEVAAFGSALEALEALRAGPAPDLILTDLHMPGLDGWMFCRLLRSPEFPAFNHIPILVTSATFTGEEPTRITADLGANAFLPAPPDRAAFREALDQLLAGETLPLSTRILVVEDSAPQRFLLTRVFTDHGHTVAAVETGVEALERAAASRPDLVVLDYHLPDMEGDRILTGLLARDPGCAVIVVTADPSPELALKVLRLGARAYVRKPFDPRYLLTLCANARREMALLNVEALLERRTQELRESETRLKLALEASGDAVWDWDLAGGRTVVSETYGALLGWEDTGFVPHLGPEALRVHPEDQARVREAWHEVRSGQVERFEVEARVQHADGRWLHVLTRAQVILRDESGDPVRVVGVHTDVTRTRRAALALAASEEKLSRIFNLSPSAIILARVSDSILLDVNDSFCLHTGYPREEAIGRTVPELDLYLDPDARSRLLADLAREGEILNRELQFRRRDGQPLVGLLSARLLELEGETCLLAIISDITEQHRIQEAHQALQEQMRQLQKLESVGRLAGGVAHDFNNLLAPMLTYAELLADEFGPGDPRGEKARQIQRAARRGRDLTRQLLAFSRKQVLDLASLDLREVVRGFEKLLRRTLREDIALQLDLPPELPPVKADPGQVEQVLMNLAVNAQDAMPEGGLLSIGLAPLILPRPAERAHPGVPPGTYVVMAVGDTGCGMDAEVQQRMFEPFFTTKEPGKGTGLGLATVFGIVKQHGGHLWVDSEPGAGTTFRLYFPATPEAPVAAGADAEPLTPAGPSTVVLVEDDPEVRGCIEAMLQHMGHRVIACDGPLDALARLERWAHPVNLLLTDVVMPKLSGPELHRLLLVRQPGLPVVFMSGHTPEAVAGHGLPEGSAAFLQKPFTAAELDQRLREVLPGC